MNSQLKVAVVIAVAAVSVWFGGVVATADPDSSDSALQVNPSDLPVPNGWGTPPPERAAIDNALAACLERAGAEAQVITGVQGGVAWRIDGASEAEERTVYQSCGQSLREDGLVQESSPLSESELHEFYRYQVGLAQCLSALGLKINPGPSEEEFVSSGGMWSPYDDVYPHVANLREWDQLQAACPQR